MTAGQFVLCLLIIIILKESLASSPAMEKQQQQQQQQTTTCDTESASSELGQAEDSAPTDVTMGASPPQTDSPVHGGGELLSLDGYERRREGAVTNSSSWVKSIPSKEMQAFGLETLVLC